jgi:hypothetical protein
MLTIVAVASSIQRDSSLNVSAIDTLGRIGVYHDENCSQEAYSVDWGVLSPGDIKKFVVYVRNEGNKIFSLIVNAINWLPTEASKYFKFSSSCSDNTIGVGKVVMVTQVLEVALDILGISAFSFDILLEGRKLLTFSDFPVTFANNPALRIIYPSTEPNKPLNCNAALPTDWVATKFVFNILDNPIEGLDTQDGFVNQTNGKPLGNAGTAIISFGGPFVNLVSRYAESDSKPQMDQAPLKYCEEGETAHFQLWNGSRIYGAELPMAAISYDQDVFLLEIYEDGEGRYIMLCYGFGWKGTYAAGEYFAQAIYPTLSLRSESWIVVRWTDVNQNGFIDGPQEGDGYTIVATGN